MIPHGTGEPVEDGLYVCNIYYGWKILEWRDGRWRFEVHGLWAGGEPYSWIGPLPEAEKPGSPKPVENSEGMEWDL